MPAETEKLVLREPSEREKRDGGGKFHIFTTADGKRRLTCFDGSLVDKWVEKGLAGVEHDYLVTTNDKGSTIVAIPGVYEKPRPAGRGFGGGGPSLSDAQAALFAAATSATPGAGSAAIIGIARDFLGFLRANTTTPASRTAAPPPAPKPSEAKITDEQIARVRELRGPAGAYLVDDEAYKDLLDRFEVNSAAELTQQAAQKFIGLLRAASEKRAS